MRLQSGSFLGPVTNRIVWHGVPTLLIEFSTSSDVSIDDDADTAGDVEATLSVDGTTVSIAIDDLTCELTRPEAAALRDAIDDALTSRREFLRTVGEHREDGSYVVKRRGADSAGNKKVFHDVEELRRLFDRLPEEFTASDVERSGITGSRRHMILQHLCEHPAFDCVIETRNPLTGKKE